MNQINLTNYGLTQRFLQQASNYPEYHLARVMSQHGQWYQIVTEEQQMRARVSGAMMHTAAAPSDYPAVGDWVMVDRTNDSEGEGIIHSVLYRKSLLTRASAGTRQDVQIIAANIDLIFICMSLNSDFNIRRLERYLSAAYESMATPVVLLTKADLCTDPEQKYDQIRKLYPAIDIIVTSLDEEEGLQELRKMINPETTIAFVGSSGVGKSTLINLLAGSEIMPTSEIRSDDKGRHTTTHREMIVLPQGGVLIDTPGMREFRLGDADVSSAFEDIEALAEQCRFRDCKHENEPGCAVKEAVLNETLSEKRLASYRKLCKEAEYAGMNSRQMEEQKIKNMFGSKSEMKQKMKYHKNKKNRH